MTPEETPPNPQLESALAFVDRPRSEMTPKAKLVEGHWVGMPAYQPSGELLKITIRFEADVDRLAFVERFGFRVVKKTPLHWSMRWPDQEDADSASTRFVEAPR